MSAAPYPGRILMTADTVGAVFDYAVELSTALSRRGVEVLLATMGAPLSPGQVRALAAIDRLKVFESRFKLEWMEEPWGDVAQAAEWLTGDREHDAAQSRAPQWVYIRSLALARALSRRWAFLRSFLVARRRARAAATSTRGVSTARAARFASRVDGGCAEPSDAAVA